MRPTSTFAASISRVAIPPEFISEPANTKNGMARSVKEFVPVNIRCAMACAAFSGPSTAIAAKSDGKPMAMATGTDAMMSTTMPMTRIKAATAAGDNILVPTFR